MLTPRFRTKTTPWKAVDYLHFEELISLGLS